MSKKEALVFHSDYTGPRWRYGLDYRPATSANIPKGWIIGSERESREFKFGTIDYPFELLPEDVDAFQLRRWGSTAGWTRV